MSDDGESDRAQLEREPAEVEAEVARRLEAQRREIGAAEVEALRSQVEAEREAAAKLEAARREVEQARADAAAIRAEAEQVAGELRVELGAVVEHVRRLQVLAAGLRKAQHVENWHGSHNPTVVGRREVVTGMPVPRLAPLVFKLARVLAEVGGSDAQMDQLKADQVHDWGALL